MAEIPRVSELLRTLIQDPHADGELGDEFVTPMIRALESSPPDEIKKRAMLARGLMDTSSRKFQPQAYQRFQDYCKLVLTQDSSNPPPPSRLGQRTLADVLEGRVGLGEFAAVFYSHLSIISTQNGFLDLLRSIMADYQPFLMLASGESIPELFPQVSSLGALLAAGYQLRGEGDEEMMRRMEIHIKSQLALAWVAHELPKFGHPIFADENGGRITAPEVQRLERLINAASLVSGDGRIPRSINYNEDYKWAVDLIALVREAVLATQMKQDEDTGRSYIVRFDDATVQQTFEDAIPYLPAGFEFAAAVVDSFIGDIERGSAFAERLLSRVPTALWSVVPETDRGVSRADLLERPAYDWLKRAIRLEFQARYYYATGNLPLASLRFHRASHELRRGMMGPQGEVAAELSGTLFSMANRLYHQLSEEERRSSNVSQLLFAPFAWGHPVRSVKSDPPLAPAPLSSSTSSGETTEESPLYAAVIDVAEGTSDETAVAAEGSAQSDPNEEDAFPGGEEGARTTLTSFKIPVA